MLVAIVASHQLKKEILQKPVLPGISVKILDELSDVDTLADAVFYLLEEETLQKALPALTKFMCPVVVNAVITTLNNLPENFIRINAWVGFLGRGLLEVAAKDVAEHQTKNLFTKMGWHFKLVADVPGFIAARIIAMLINEAYFALADDVADKNDIDTAMKLGTNYLFGPFEWGEKIGLKNVAALLTTLSQNDLRYTPSPLLIQQSIL